MEHNVLVQINKWWIMGAQNSPIMTGREHWDSRQQTHFLNYTEETRLNLKPDCTLTYQ